MPMAARSAWITWPTAWYGKRLELHMLTLAPAVTWPAAISAFAFGGL